MSMNGYYVLPIQTEEKDYIWCVMESSTEQLIDAFVFKDDALEYANFLGRGGGFDGWTPTFMLQEVAAPKDLNLEFSELLASDR